MGVRKHNKAKAVKEAKKQIYSAKLMNCPTSPRKMRLVVDLVRGVNIDKALHILKHSSKEASGKVEKLLLSAIANWQSKNEGVRIEDSNLYIKNIYVDNGRILRRILPAPQGRAHRIRKRSNHVTLFLESRLNDNNETHKITESSKEEMVKVAEVKKEVKAKAPKTTKAKKEAATPKKETKTNKSK